MIRILLCTAVVLTFSLPMVVRAEGIGLRLESSVGHKLPALPIPLRVVAVNSASSSLFLPRQVFFHASREGAEMFLGGKGTGWYKDSPIRDEDLDPNWDPRIVLEPGKTITAEFPVRHDCADPSFFLNAFLWVPGRYQLRVLAAEDTERLLSAMQGDSLSEVVQTVPDLVLSEPVTIDILEPTGVDAEAWNYLRERTQRSHWPYSVGLGDDGSILQALRERFPTSRYTLCVAAAGTRDMSLVQLETLASQLRAAPKPQYMLEWIELTIARHHRSECWGHLKLPRDVPAAADECEKSHALLRQIVKSAKNSMVLEMAKADLAAASRRQDIYDFAAELDGKAARENLRPFVTCSKEIGGALEVTYGYENPLNEEAAFPIGPSNRFAPAPEDRGQPVTFLPGRHPHVVTIQIKAKKDDPAGAISWTLNGITATSSKSDPKCK